MCASYGLQAKPQDIHSEFGIIDEKTSADALAGWLEEFRDEPAKPTGVHRRNLNPIVRERERDGEHRRTLDLAWWKLWVRGEPAKFPAINARVENLVGSGAWGAPFASRRALVPATEYYEKGHVFRLPQGLFAFAGLWSVAKEPSGEWMVSYAIVTQPAAAHIAAIHDRMPLILPAEEYDTWLDPDRRGDEGLVEEAIALGREFGARLEVSER